MKNLRGVPRLVYQPDLYQRVIGLHPSPANKLEFCMGSIQEMTEGSLTEAIEQYGAQKRIRCIHFRNVRGKVPCHDEVFLDEGDIDMLSALRQLQQLEFDGVLIIPRKIAPEVVEKALVKASTEKTMRKAIDDGMLMTEAFARFGALWPGLCPRLPA